MKIFAKKGGRKAKWEGFVQKWGGFHVKFF